MADDRIQLRNPEPTKSSPKMERATYSLARSVALAVIPAREPGITLPDYLETMRRSLPKAEGWPAGASAGWWAMAIKLDLEARGELRRVKAKPPQRLVRTG